MKEYRSIVFTSNFAKLEKHQSEKWRQRFKIMDFPIDVGIIL
jgi:hypothetical protein